MSFFLPSRLVALEYLTGDEEPDSEYAKLAKSYRDDIDFAFFVVEFGFSRQEYESLTEREIYFIRKAWENREVRNTNLINMAVSNALANLHRKKGKPPIPLWKKSSSFDKQKAKDGIKVIEEIEARDGKNWVQKLWAANRQIKQRGDKK